MTLQEDMFEYRAKNRLSQEKLAHLCGLSLQTVNSVENGLQTPSKMTERKIRMIIEENKENEYT